MIPTWQNNNNQPGIQSKVTQLTRDIRNMECGDIMEIEEVKIKAAYNVIRRIKLAGPKTKEAIRDTVAIGDNPRPHAHRVYTIEKDATSSTGYVLYRQA